MPWPTALGDPHLIFPNTMTLTMACEPSNISVIEVPVRTSPCCNDSHSCSPVYRTTVLITSIAAGTRSKYAILLEIQLTLARMQAFHELMGKASSASTTYEITILNTRGTDLKPSVCASLITARMLAKSESMLLKSQQLNVQTTEIRNMSYFTICCLQAQQSLSFPLPLHWGSQSSIK